MLDFVVAFGSVFFAVALWYSFDQSNPKIDSIFIPVLGVFVYRVFGRLFRPFLKKYFPGLENDFTNLDSIYCSINVV